MNINEDFFFPTQIQLLEKEDNHIFIKREDLIPFSFGGNKVRKAFLFFEEIDKQHCDYVVTYGSSSSNHCRVVSNMCAQRGFDCFIVSPEESSKETFNSRLMKSFGAKITVVPVSRVYDTIEQIMAGLRKEGRKPYFIPGGGHGNIGTQAYVDCYKEITKYEKETVIHFDYIFLASGTGTTQAGLVCGQILNQDNRKIIGISIARKNPYGRDVVLDSIREYLKEFDEKEIQEKTIFLDDYIADGYGSDNQQIRNTIDIVMKKYGIPLDPTYTGKAFYGMEEYLKKNKIKNKNILFIHTGGTPLYFDYLYEKGNK